MKVRMTINISDPARKRIRHLTTGKAGLATREEVKLYIEGAAQEALGEADVDATIYLVKDEKEPAEEG